MRTTIFLSTLYLVFGFFACSNVENKTPDGSSPASKSVRLYAYNEARSSFAAVVLRDGNCMPDAGTNICREYLVNKIVGDYDVVGSDLYDHVDEPTVSRLFLPVKASGGHGKAEPLLRQVGNRQ